MTTNLIATTVTYLRLLFHLWVHLVLPIATYRLLSVDEYDFVYELISNGTGTFIFFLNLSPDCSGLTVKSTTLLNTALNGLE